MTLLIFYIPQCTREAHGCPVTYYFLGAGGKSQANFVGKLSIAMRLDR